MKVQGLQKLTLLDYPGKVACTVFTPGCNFACPFCHNASLVTRTDGAGEGIAEEELFDFLRKRKGILDGVCVTGGEPLLQKGFEEFARKVKNLGYALKLDTNGSFPDKLLGLIDEGLLDYVAMDIKNSPAKYPLTAGRADIDLDAVKRSVAILKEGRVPYEFRTTVVKELHNAADMEEIGKWLSGAEKYFLQGFVDSGDLISEGLSAVSGAEMRIFREIVAKYVKEASLRGID